MPVYETSTAQETAKLGVRFAKQLQGGEAICLSGPLGSGKTTFVTGLVGHFLPVTRVLSPTFTLIRQYRVAHPTILHIYHLDLYRLSGNAAMRNLGLEDYINQPGTVVLIEWPEKLKEVSLKKRIEISFSIADDTKRVITVSS